MVRPAFDERLFVLKYQELVHGLSEKTHATTLRVLSEQRKLGQSGGHVRLVDAHLEILREQLQGMDRICREVWRTQGGIDTPEFVREVLRSKALMVVASGCDGIHSKIQRTARRSGHSHQFAPAFLHLALEKSRLAGQVSNRYEIEVRELGYRNMRAGTLAKETVEEKRAQEIAVSPPKQAPVHRKVTRTDPEVAKRRSLVQSNSGEPAHEMCEVFDRQNVPLPVKWQGAGFKKWLEAYRSTEHRKRIHVLIAKDRASG